MQTKTKANLRCYRQVMLQKEEGDETYREEINNRWALIKAKQEPFGLFLSFGCKFEIILKF